MLYEMVTRRRAFEGKSQLSVLSAILEREPAPIATVEPTSPPALDYTVTTCLEKDPANRFQTAHDLKLQLAFIARSGSQVGAPVLAARKRSRNVLWVAALAVLSVAVIALAAALWSARQPGTVFRTNLLPPEGTQFETLYRNGAPALSPDGKRVAFVARQEGKNSIWVRSLDKLEASPLRGTEDAFFPFWSPDSASLGFFMQGKLWRMDASGGSPTAICDVLEPRGGTWGRDGTIVFAPYTAGPLAAVPATGGTPKPVTRIPSTVPNLSDRWPFFLPDGKHFLFLYSPTGAADDHNEIRLASLDGREERAVLKGRVYAPQYASGWLLAVREGALQAWKFDPSNGTMSDQAVQLVDKIGYDDITAASVFSVSKQGLLLYQRNMGSTGERHIWMDASGKQVAQISEPAVYGAVRLSPDGSRIATPLTGHSGYGPLWVWDLKGGTRAPLSSATGYADATVWSTDGRSLYFDVSDDQNNVETHFLPADGSRPEQPLIKSDKDTFPTDITSDGKWLLYEEMARGAATKSTALKAFPLVQGPEPFTVLDNLAPFSNARLKPTTNDWLAYQSNQSGRAEVYLTRFPHPAAKYQVSQTGGTQPVWSKDGKTLYYLDLVQKLTAVNVQTANESVQIGAPRTLFQTGIRHSILSGGYDVSRDGKFLLVNSVSESAAPMVLVTNWDSELKK